MQYEYKMIQATPHIIAQRKNIQTTVASAVLLTEPCKRRDYKEMSASRYKTLLFCPNCWNKAIYWQFCLSA